MKWVAVVVAAAVAFAGVLAYRHHHRQQVLTQGIARARELARPDNWGGWRDAAQVLEPLVEIDPVRAGAERAHALSVLAADYRDSNAAAEAERLLVEPERASEVPPPASLARAMLALGRGEGGTAVSHASRPGTGAAGKVILGRLALLAGNAAGAASLLGEAVAADPSLPSALAAHGDALRRTGKPEEAHAAYAAALVASPRHPRAAYGMAKLALGGKARPDEAITALQRLLSDGRDTPRNERARAALHLAAIQGRASDRAGAQRTMATLDLSTSERPWMERAVTEEELPRAGYRVVDGAPASLRSASDDDPFVPPPPAPPPPPPRAPTIQDQAKKIIAKPAAKKPAKSKSSKSKSKTSTSKNAKGARP